MLSTTPWRQTGARPPQGIGTRTLICSWRANASIGIRIQNWALEAPGDAKFHHRCTMRDSGFAPEMRNLVQTPFESVTFDYSANLAFVCPSRIAPEHQALQAWMLLLHHGQSMGFTGVAPIFSILEIERLLLS